MSQQDWNTALARGGTLVLDGGTSSELRRRGMALDSKFFLELEQGVRCHQVRLQGGDASSDSFCFS